MPHLRFLEQIVFELLVFYLEQEIFMICKNWQKKTGSAKLEMVITHKPMVWHVWLY